MTQVPEFLFLVTSTAVVLGVAITVRGLLGFRPVAESPALATATPSPGHSPTDPPDDLPATSTDQEDVAPSAPVAVGPRDLREPMIMTLAGVIIATIALFTLGALINSG